MCRIEPIELSGRRVPIRAAVLDLLALAAPMPAALGAPDAEEQAFLEALRRIVVRSQAEDLWDRYHAPSTDGVAVALSRYRD